MIDAAAGRCARRCPAPRAGRRSSRARCTPPLTNAASTPPAIEAGSARKAMQREPPATEARLQQQEDADRPRRRAMPSMRSLRVLALGVFAQELRVVLERELHLLEPVVDLFGHRAEVASGDIRHDIDIRRDGLVPQHRRRRHDADVGDIAQATCCAGRFFPPTARSGSSDSGVSPARPRPRRRRSSVPRTGSRPSARRTRWPRRAARRRA